MLLVDHQIRELALRDGMIDPFSEAVSGNGVISYGLDHAGYCLRLGGEIWYFKNTYGDVVDARFFSDEGFCKRVFDKVTYGEGEGFVLAPHSYVLGQSLEYLRIPPNLKGRTVGKSTLARMGVLINVTPAEPGWHGILTIEIGNISPSPVRLRVGEGIAQLEFERLDAACETTYADKRGKYQGQTGVTPARVL